MQGPQRRRLRPQRRPSTETLPEERDGRWHEPQGLGCVWVSVENSEVIANMFQKSSLFPVCALSTWGPLTVPVIFGFKRQGKGGTVASLSPWCRAHKGGLPPRKSSHRDLAPPREARWLEHIRTAKTP